jgi:hypothetical protein
MLSIGERCVNWKEWILGKTDKTNSLGLTDEVIVGMGSRLPQV